MSVPISTSIIVFGFGLMIGLALLFALNAKNIINRVFRRKGGFVRQLRFMWVVIFLLMLIMVGSDDSGSMIHDIEFKRKKYNIKQEYEIEKLKHLISILDKQVNPEIKECKKWCKKTP